MESESFLGLLEIFRFPIPIARLRIRLRSMNDKVITMIEGVSG